jgi:hypothetical protein
MFTRARHWSLSSARLIQSTPTHTVSLRFIVILSHHPNLDLPNGLSSPQVFEQAVLKINTQNAIFYNIKLSFSSFAAFVVASGRYVVYWLKRFFVTE